MPDRDKPNATIAQTNCITQRQELLELNFIGDYNKLDASVRRCAVD
jgi:hypothetical protein